MTLLIKLHLQIVPFLQKGEKVSPQLYKENHIYGINQATQSSVNEVQDLKKRDTSHKLLQHGISPIPLKWFRHKITPEGLSIPHD